MKSIKKNKAFLQYWLPVILWGAFILLFSIQPDLKSGFPAKWDLVLRRVGHVGVYFVMMSLLARALLAAHGAKDKSTILAAIFTAGLCSLIIAFCDENIQKGVPGRVGSVQDVGLDLLGIISAASLLLLRRNKKKIVPF